MRGLLWKWSELSSVLRRDASTTSISSRPGTLRYSFYAGQTCLIIACQQWNGRFAKRIELKDIGVVIQLGHPAGERCPAPVPAPRDFLVIDVNGFHPMNILFCQCDQVHLAGNRTQQLLRSDLFGATTQDPRTCCTLRVLKHFHLLTLQSKINAYDYYKSLEKLTDNTGLNMRYVCTLCGTICID